MKEIMIGTRYVWVDGEYPIAKGIIVDIKDFDNEKGANVIMEWYEGGTLQTGSRLIRYHRNTIQNETRIQIDKEYYRNQKLKELGI
jgi:hypothetical protein